MSWKTPPSRFGTESSKVMNPNLVPTVIVNKNGVTTTVHKKPVGSHTVDTPLPAPAVTTSPARTLTDAERSDMISKMHRRLWVISGREHSDIIRDQLLTYSDNALTAMNEFLLSEVEGNVKETRHQLAFLKMLCDPRYRDTGHTVHEYLTFKPVLQQKTSSIIDGMALVRALHDYKQLPVMDSYGDADQETQEQIAALLTVAQGLLDKYKYHQRETLGAAPISGSHSQGKQPAIPNPLEFGIPLYVEWNVRLVGDDLISLIMEQPENAEAISKVIVQDGINDAALLREIFDSETPALRSGLL